MIFEGNSLHDSTVRTPCQEMAIIEGRRTMRLRGNMRADDLGRRCARLQVLRCPAFGGGPKVHAPEDHWLLCWHYHLPEVLCIHAMKHGHPICIRQARSFGADHILQGLAGPSSLRIAVGFGCWIGAWYIPVRLDAILSRFSSTCEVRPARRAANGVGECSALAAVPAADALMIHEEL